MPKIAFDELPGHGRLWVFPSTRELTEAEARVVGAAVDEFLHVWAAHGVPLQSAADLRERRFLLVGVDVDAEAPSGCSIDALVGRLRTLGEEFDTSLIDHAPVWYRAVDGVQCVSREKFRELADQGEVTPDTSVFDTSLTRVAQAREGALERPASTTWHARAFFKERVAG